MHLHVYRITAKQVSWRKLGHRTHQLYSSTQPPHPLRAIVCAAAPVHPGTYGLMNLETCIHVHILLPLTISERQLHAPAILAVLSQTVLLNHLRFYCCRCPRCPCLYEWHISRPSRPADLRIMAFPGPSGHLLQQHDIRACRQPHGAAACFRQKLQLLGQRDYR
jgi:hypothetical protein